MTDRKWETDEDRMIYRYKVHRNLVGWVINKLAEIGIPAQRTSGNNQNGDILIPHPQDARRVREAIAQIHQKYNRKYSV